MIKIFLSDGSTKNFEKDVTGLEVAESISSSLKKKAISIKIDGALRDLCTIVPTGSHIEIITKNHPEALDIMRHTVAAQVLGRAIKNLYPDAKLAIGPTIADGFYYDFSSSTAVSSDDIPKIEKEMKKIAATAAKINKRIVSREEAKRTFNQKGEQYKVEIIDGSDGDNFQIYEQGSTDFVDLCYGPHLPSLSMVGPFSITKVSGAYWRGDSKNEMLTRIYGTAWFSQQELTAYIERVREAEKRDHRKICKAMDLLHFQGEAPGQVFWHNNGWRLYKTLENRIRDLLRKHHYEEVNTPVVVNKSLFEQSGHWNKFGSENMFVSEAYNGTYALKPMNCPCHVQIFKNNLRSYKDLPIKMSEFGSCFRQESRGALHGLMRVAAMTQDDAHIFCRVSQIEDQVVEINEMISELYNELGFTNYKVKFSDRPDVRVGDDELWDNAESALMNAAKRANLEWEINKGEGAFYGPKLEFVLTDAIGREWQCGTIQLDFNLPIKLEASYINEAGEKEHPVMIHRALLGSMERFIGMLIEHFSGNFPLWLAPIQVVLMGITDKHKDHVWELHKILKTKNIEAIVDDRNEKINYKIRENSVKKIPYIVVIGDEEIAQNSVSVRRLGSNKQATYSQSYFVDSLVNEIQGKELPQPIKS